MRWTTSPRLTLELALVRATIPEADPNPAGLAARIERLERLAGVVPQQGRNAGAPGGEPRRDLMTPGGPNHGGEPIAREKPEPPAASSTSEGPPEGISDQVSAAAVASPGAPGSERPHAPSAGALDLAAIRRSWQQLLDRLLERRQMILRANLESVTAASYDGDTLELAFPPGRKYSVDNVQSREAQLRETFADVFGVSPRIRCVAREGFAGPVFEEEPPATREDAVARLKAQLGAEVEGDGREP